MIRDRPFLIGYRLAKAARQLHAQQAQTLDRGVCDLRQRSARNTIAHTDFVCVQTGPGRDVESYRGGVQ